MYLDFKYFAKQELEDSDWLSISSLISMLGYRGGDIMQVARHVSTLECHIFVSLTLCYYFVEIN